jgi:hypothetical protein
MIVEIKIKREIIKIKIEKISVKKLKDNRKKRLYSMLSPWTFLISSYAIKKETVKNENNN